jgi:hypothetical protein
MSHVCVIVAVQNNKYYILWACVFSLIYSACNGHAPYCHVWPMWLQYFSTLSHKWRGFWKQMLLNIKCVFWFSLQVLSETFLIGKTEWVMIINVYWSSRKVPVIPVRFLMKHGISLTDFQKILKYQISLKSVQWEQSCSKVIRQEGSHDKANSCCSQFCECAQKIGGCSCFVWLVHVFPLYEWILVNY